MFKKVYRGVEMKFENLAIILGAAAVAYVLAQTFKTQKAMESLSGYDPARATQYDNGWTSNGLTYL